MSNTQRNTIQIYDTSLRDGMQGMQINYTLDDKLQIAQQLDNLKIDYIEGGFPLSNEKEYEFFTQIKHIHLSHAKIAAFGSTAKPHSPAENDVHIRALLEADTPVVTIVAKASTSHVTDVLKTTLEENLHMIHDSIDVLKKHGREVILDLEHFFDGYKLNTEYAINVLRQGTQSGADMLVLCDTNGGTLTHEVQSIIQSLPQGTLAPLGGHFHNDCGVAVANSLIALDTGAVHVQGTINGWGERTGNANLCTIIPNLIVKDSRYTASCATEIAHLTSLSRFVAEKANVIPNPRQPFVGYASFSHKAGQHADVLLKNSALMEHMDSSTVGNDRHVLLSELAGKSTIITKLEKYGAFSKNDVVVENTIKILKEKEKQGYEYEAAEASFELILLKQLKKYEPLIHLKNYHMEQFKSSTHDSQSVCRIFLYLNNKEVMGAAVGSGPVETLDRALRNALSSECACINEIKLTDYRVRVVNPEDKTSAKVRVFITSSNGTDSWETIGVHENIVEASWYALVDSYEYYYHTVKD